MGERRAWRSLAVVALLVGAVSATTITSCGGGGGSNSNGGLCEQCGDTDGPCNIAGADLTSDQTQPAFCPNGANGACHVELICTRKLDSSQRRCFPADPKTGALDLRYECDGSRPQATPMPTPTVTPTATVSESPTPTTSSTPTGPTPTGPTPTSATPTGATTPAVTATPGPQDLDVAISLSTSQDHFIQSFTLTVAYPASKGTFGGASVACTNGNTDGGLQATDNGSGTLSVQIPSDPDNDSIDVTCVFHQLAGQTLTESNLAPTVNDSSVSVDGTTIS